MSRNATIEDLINKHRLSDNIPRDFLSKPEKDSIPVRRIMFAIKDMIDQLEKRYPSKIENLVRLIVYKRNAQQRHQGFWRDFRLLNATLRKYQAKELLELLNNLYKKLEKFNTFYYMLTPEMILHIASSYLTQLFILERLRKAALNVSNKIFGQLENNHWEALSLFLVAVCADVNYIIPEQTKKICDAYKNFSEFVRIHESSFPESCNELEVTSTLLNKGTINSLPDTTRVLKMLRLSNDDLESADIEEKIENIRKELISGKESETQDMGVSVARGVELEQNDSVDVGDNNKKKKKKKKNGAHQMLTHEVSPSTSSKGIKRKITSVDSAIETDFDSSAYGTPLEDNVFANSNSVKKKKFMKKKKVMGML